MSIFKVGDAIKIKSNKRASNYSIGHKGTVTGTWSEGVYIDNGNGMYDDDCELINSNNITNMKEKFIQMFLKEPEKSFRKAGITNGDGLITEEGQTIFLSWLLGKNGEAFKTEVVDGLLLEEKDK